MAYKAKFSYEEKVRQWKLAKGTHKLKNRSSKDILKIMHWSKKSIYRSMSNATLQEMSKNNNFDADMELRRRRDKNAKKDAKKIAKENA